MTLLPPAPPPPPPAALQGAWNLFGAVLKVLKNISKHEAARACLSKSGEVVLLLLGVARLLSRLPEQRKLLKVRVGPWCEPCFSRVISYALFHDSQHHGIMTHDIMASWVVFPTRASHGFMGGFPYTCVMTHGVMEPWLPVPARSHRLRYVR